MVRGQLGVRSGCGEPVGLLRPRHAAVVGAGVVRLVRQAAIVVAESGRRASIPRSRVRSSAVSALMARVRSLVTWSRAVVRTRRMVRIPASRGGAAARR